jgi:hypothetical protein
MSQFLTRAVRAVDRFAGLGIEQTYLYRLAYPSLPSTAPSTAGVTWHLLSPGGLKQLLDIGSVDVSESSKRLHRGDICYVACVDGRLAHYAWVQKTGSHPITDAGVSEQVDPREFWIYDCRTAGWARGRGIYPATLIRIVNEQFEAGCRTAWIYTSRENIASQKGIQRAGFGLLKSLKALRVGRRYYPLGGSGPVASG